jgi:hypothetical protein
MFQTLHLLHWYVRNSGHLFSKGFEININFIYDVLVTKLEWR